MENKKPKPQLVQIQPNKSIALTVQSPQRQIRPAPAGAQNQTIQILQGQSNQTPILINNGQIQLQQQIQQPQQRLVFLQPVQQPNGQLTYIQSQQQIQPKPQQSPRQVLVRQVPQSSSTVNLIEPSRTFKTESNDLRQVKQKSNTCLFTCL